MSVQFGICTFDGTTSGREYLDRVSNLLDLYGPDGETHYQRDGVDMLYRPFHTTTESRTETQPTFTPSGAVITWDGRLDNRIELARDLQGLVSADSSDASIVGAAYQRWDTESFRKLAGDWAVSVWDPHERSVTLAKDPIGTRHLYYAVEKDRIAWSTILDPLVLLAEHGWELDEEYIAGCLAFFPAANCTPYRGIHSVPPASYVLVRPSGKVVRKYWEFDSQNEIRYKTEAEYEEHFRAVFAQSVARRLRSDGPILAELSGGIDSASIVLMADSVIKSGNVTAQQLDTVSYYDDSDPNWNERPFFTKVEEKRGRNGYHIALQYEDAFSVDLECDGFRATPSSPTGGGAQQNSDREVISEHRVVLSGIGGDEVLGGVPTALPEIQDLVWSADVLRLGRRLKDWSLETRTPWFQLLFGAIRGFLPPVLAGVSAYRRPAPWLDSSFVKRHRACFRGYEKRIQFSGSRPSFQENLATLGEMQRQLEISALRSNGLHEKRYPYLDRDLLEFVYAIPREQVIRPGQRRSLMRRALAGIVPHEILFRKRKAVAARGGITAASVGWNRLQRMPGDLAVVSLGIVDRNAFLSAITEARHGLEVPLVPLIRTIAVELWLRNVIYHGVVPGVLASQKRRERTKTKSC